MSLLGSGCRVLTCPQISTSSSNPTLFFPHRHSSYGRLLDDHDYGSWGNYNNPLYDDS